MRQSRTFAATPGALQRNTERVTQQQITRMLGQVGACQAKIMQGVRMPANREWMHLLEIRIAKLRCKSSK